MRHTIPLLALLLIILAACGESTNTSASSTPTKAAQPTATPTVATPGHHKLGETVKIYFAWEITIQKVEAKAENKEPGSLVSELPAEKGDMFLVLSLQAKNISSIEQQFDTKSFSMKDAQGVPRGMMNLSAPVRPDPSSRVAQNEITAGDITFEVPVNQRKFTLTYEMAMANANTPGQSLFIWDITIP